MKKWINKYHELARPTKAGMWFLLCNFLQKGITALATPIYTRLLSTSEYGEISTYLAWMDILSLVITFGLPSTAARGLVKNEENKNGYISSLLGLTTVMAMGSFACFFLIQKPMIAIMGLSFSAIITIYIYTLSQSTVELWMQRQRTDYCYKSAVAVTLGMSILRPLLCVVLVILCPRNKVPARITGDLIVTAVFGIIFYVVLFHRSGRFYSKKIWKESLHYSLPLIPHYLSQRVLSQSDRLMIKAFVGISQAGIYSLAYSVGNLLSMLNSAIDATVAPWIYRKIKERQFDRIRDFCQSVLFLFSLCTVCFSLAAPELFRFFAAPEYFETIDLIPIIAASSYFVFLYVQFIYFEYYVGKTQYIMVATILSAAVNIVLNYIAIPLYGYKIAAVTTLICYVLYAVGHFFIMQYLCQTELGIKQPFQVSYLIGVSVGVIIASVLCKWLYNFTVARYVLFCIMTLFVGERTLRLCKRYGKQG